MAGGATTFEAGQYLNYALRGVAPAYDGTLYLRLLTAPSTRTANGTETDYGSYARIPLPRDLTFWSDPTSTGRATNLAAFTFAAPTSLGSGLDIVAFDVVNTASGSFTRRHYYGPVSPTRTPALGRALRFPAGALEITA